MRRRLLNSVVPETNFASEPAQGTLNFQARTTSSLTFNFSGTGTGRVVVIRPGTDTPQMPEDGVAYTNANSIYSYAPDIGNNTRVVSFGDNTLVAITGLTRNTTYTAALFEYNIKNNDNTTIKYNRIIASNIISQATMR